MSILFCRSRPRSLAIALVDPGDNHIPGYDAGKLPAFTLMASYHWTISLPDLLPSLALFIILHHPACSRLFDGCVTSTPSCCSPANRSAIPQTFFVNRAVFPFRVVPVSSADRRRDASFLVALHSLLAADCWFFAGKRSFERCLDHLCFPVLRAFPAGPNPARPFDEQGLIDACKCRRESSIGKSCFTPGRAPILAGRFTQPSCCFLAGRHLTKLQVVGSVRVRGPRGE